MEVRSPIYSRESGVLRGGVLGKGCSSLEFVRSSEGESVLTVVQLGGIAETAKMGAQAVVNE